MKYRKRPVVVDAEVYRDGLEDGFMVHFSGNIGSYKRNFGSYEDAQEFIDDNMGYPLVDIDDRDYGIIYEEPVPYIRTVKGKEWFYPDSYIITDAHGARTVLSSRKFHEVYEEVTENAE